MTLIQLNNFTCPICDTNHETLSNYSTIVCKRCIYMYGLTNEYDESMTVGFDKNMFFYSEVNGLLSFSKECYVLGKHCYINTENRTISIIATVPIPQNIKLKKNKLKK